VCFTSSFKPVFALKKTMGRQAAERLLDRARYWLRIAIFPTLATRFGLQSKYVRLSRPLQIRGGTEPSHWL
jgi:hypothetical protein